jgi:hypothetical protein
MAPVDVLTATYADAVRWSAIRWPGLVSTGRICRLPSQEAFGGPWLTSSRKPALRSGIQLANRLSFVEYRKNPVTLIVKLMPIIDSEEVIDCRQDVAW